MSIEKDVVSHSVNGRDLHVDLYRPDGKAVPTRTAVLLVHGGGWMVGERAWMGPLAGALAAKGYLGVAVEYRLAREAPWPSQLEDVVAAVRWVAENAERLGVEKDRIVVAGASAGAQLVMLATAKLRENPKVAAVISLFGANELTVDAHPEKGQFGAAMLLGPDATEEKVRGASPLHQVTAAFPPTFLLHGAGDWLIDPVASVRVYEKLTSLGVTAELHLYANGLHEFLTEPRMTEPVASEIAVFLSRIIVDAEAWKAEALENNIFAAGPAALQARIAAMAAGEGH